MDSCCVGFKANVHVNKGLDCVKNGFFGKKIDYVANGFCKRSRNECKKIKKLEVVNAVLKSPVDEEMLTFETSFFDEKKVDPKTVASIILGGGAGTRLFPLTGKRAKPAVPIGGCYRLIDVPMSNCINSGIRKIFILTQFNSFSLNRHLARTYNFGNGMSFGDGFVEVLAATQTPGEAGKKWFQGTADAVRQFIWLFEDAKNKNVENVVILSGDHLYRMDYMDFVQKHVDTNADITVSCIPMDDSRASDFGLMKIDETGRIVHFAEKPKGSLLKSMQVDTTVLGLSDHEALKTPYIASMGVYVFRTEVLLELLKWKYPSCNDFGSEIIPSAVAEHNVQAYLFKDYWEDIGTIKSFFDANLALTEQPPRFDFNDPKTPFFTSPRFLPPTKVEKCRIVDAIISHGCFLRDCSVEHSVVGIRSRLDEGVELKDTMMIGADYYQTDSEIAAMLASGRVPIGVGQNTKITNCIIDKNAKIGKNVVIANKDNVEEADRSDEGFYIRSGITVILKNATIKDGTIV
ncbi:glucose-1-phosphate adenylyltransferase large subunit [Tanacetum coccineum]